ncbi:hypothetical protein BGZ80_007177, partial [Entomortierella chlamydospora]
MNKSKLLTLVVKRKADLMEKNKSKELEGKITDIIEYLLCRLIISPEMRSGDSFSEAEVVVTEESSVNDGNLSRAGPMDAFLHAVKQPRVFGPTAFDDLLVRFVVTTKQSFSIVGNPAFKDLLNHATMAEMSQAKLPSDDAMATK